MPSGRVIVFTTFAGRPATTVYGATSSRTSDPPATTACSPIVSGPSTRTWLASHTPSPITTSRPDRGKASWRSRPNFSMSWVPVRIATSWPKNASLPTVIVPPETLNSALLTIAVSWIRSRLASPCQRWR